MGRAKKVRAHKVKHAAKVKKIIAPNKDPRLKSTEAKRTKAEKERREEEEARNVEQTPASMFFAHNAALGPPFHASRRALAASEYDAAGHRRHQLHQLFH